MTRFIVALAILFFAIAPAAGEGSPMKEEPHPLGAWAKLVGGEWHAKGTWEGGTPFESRLVAKWGVRKAAVRLRIFVPAKDGESLRYDSVCFLHPGTKKPTYLSTSFDGEVASGEFTIDGDTVTFVFPGKTPAATLKSTYRFGKKDRCRWTVEHRPDEEWTALLDVTWTREKRAPKKRIATKPPDRKDLEPLARLVGTFDVVGKLPADQPRLVRVESRWGLGRVIVTDYLLKTFQSRQLKDRAFVWFDREKKVFREFRFVDENTIAESTFTVDGDVVIRESTIWADGGENVGRFRKTIRIESADRHTWDEVMKLKSGREIEMEHDMVATRVKEKAAK